MGDLAKGTHYVCVRPEHVGTGDLTHGHFTVKSGTWGYCAGARPQPDHIWEEVDGVLLGSPQELAYRIRALVGVLPGRAEQDEFPTTAVRF